MPLLDAPAVADLIDEIGDRLELSGELPFKVRAYRNAADVLRGLKAPLHDLVASRKLIKLPGIGEALAEKIISLHKKGTHPTLERLREEISDGLLHVYRVPGLGPKKVLALRDAAGVTDLDLLEAAVREGKLAGLKGFGPKLQAKVLDALPFVRASVSRLLRPQAERRLAEAVCKLKGIPGVQDVLPAGEFRRSMETVGELTVVVAAPATTEVPTVLDEVRIVHAVPECLGAALFCATGTTDFVRAAQTLAASQGGVLTAVGLKKGTTLLNTPREEDLFEALGLPYIAPELRETAAALEAARLGKLPKLIEPGDVKGILHSHTSRSDGMHTLEEMCEATRALGLSYYGVCDHSQSAVYAGGMREDKIAAQHAEADALNVKYHKLGLAFRVFKGIESDILEDGALDYPEAVLERFDFIVASVHSRFELDEKAQTARVLKALANPYTTILGHCTGRILLRREGLKLDLELVLQAAAQHGVVVEINAHPSRLDLDWRWHRRALELGCKVSLNPDAHSTSNLEVLRYGIDVARKGGVEAKDNLTSLTAAELAAYFEQRKQRGPCPARE